MVVFWFGFNKSFNCNKTSILFIIKGVRENMQELKPKSQWDIHCAAILLQTYLEIAEKGKERRQAIASLKKRLDDYIRNKNKSVMEGCFSDADIYRQMGMLEYLMTNGRRGLLGMPLPCVKEIVEIYRLEPEQYKAYIKQTTKNSDAELAQSMMCEKTLLYKDKEDVIKKEPDKGNMCKKNENLFSESLEEENLFCSEKKIEAVAGSVLMRGIQNEQMTDDIEGKYYGFFLNSCIMDLPLTVRIKHCLMRNNICTVKALLEYPEDQFIELPNMGRKSVDILLTEISQIRREVDCYSENNEKSEVLDHVSEEGKVISVNDHKKKLDNWISDFCAQLHIRESYVRGCLRESGIKKHTNIDKVRMVLWADSRMRKLLWKFIFFRQRQEKVCRISIEELKSWFPVSFYEENGFFTFLEELKKQKKIDIQGQEIHFDCLSLEEFVQSIPNERNREIVSMRFDGLTLETIAKKRGITRERVRQIQKKCLAQKPILKEDQYKKFLDQYQAIEFTDLQRIFDLSDRVLQYLKIEVNHNAVYTEEERLHALKKLAQDSHLTVVEQVRVHALIAMIDSCFNICGRKVKKNRPALIKYTVETYAQNKISCSELKKHYDRLLENLGLAGNASFEVDLRYFDHLSFAPYTLWNRGKKVRYYDLSGGDYDELLKALNLDQYSDAEYSSLKFFRDYSDLMKKYDIRDEYELHNLLRKILTNQGGMGKRYRQQQIEFDKMPIIKFGHCSRNKQILKIIEENGPVTKAQIGKLYEETYGIQAMLVQSSTDWEEFASYCINGRYVVHTEKGLPPEVIMKMKEVLTEDFYTMQDIIGLYLDTIPGGNAWDISFYTLHQMGYVSHVSYVIQEKYKTTSDFFRKILTDGDIIDLRDKSYYRSISSYYLISNQLSLQYQIVEAKSNIFYTRPYLEKLGITVQEMQKFCELIQKWVPENTFFTVTSICKSGFLLPWSETNLGEYFYSSVLASDTEHFATILCGGGRLLWNGKREKPISVGELLMHILDETDEILSVRELQLRIQVKYGLYFKTEKIKGFIQNHDEYEDKLMI